jgi:hypothetical protein
MWQVGTAVLEPEWLCRDADNLRVEVERDEMVTLTPGFKRHVTLRCRQPPIADKVTLPATRTHTRRNGATDSNLTDAAS